MPAHNQELDERVVQAVLAQGSIDFFDRQLEDCPNDGLHYVHVGITERRFGNVGHGFQMVRHDGLVWFSPVVSHVGSCAVRH